MHTSHSSKYQKRSMKYLRQKKLKIIDASINSVQKFNRFRCKFMYMYVYIMYSCMFLTSLQVSESVVRGCSIKKLFRKIWPRLPENTCNGVFFCKHFCRAKACSSAVKSSMKKDKSLQSSS